MTSQFELVISDQAKEDMLDIWQYIALDSIDNADQFIDFIYEKCVSLCSTPRIGRKRDELLPGIRVLPVKRYLVFYRIQTKNIEIVRVLSAYRDLNSLF